MMLQVFSQYHRFLELSIWFLASCRYKINLALPIRSAEGRANAVVKTTDFVYVFEFKLNGSTEETLKQIDDKGYLLPYNVDHRQLIKVGVSFDSTERNIGAWRIVK